MSAHVDWPKLLHEISWLLGEQIPGHPHLRDPVGTPTLAKHLGRTRSTVYGWIEGKEPKHSEGEMLVAAWVRLTGKAEVYVPRARPALSANHLAMREVQQQKKMDTTGLELLGQLGRVTLGKRKITDEQRADIMSSNESVTELARKHGISYESVRRLKQSGTTLDKKKYGDPVS